MKILIAGGNSSIGRALKAVLSEWATVITAGRKNCDVYLDLTDPIEKMQLPANIDVVINAAAHFGGKTAKDIYDAENTNVLGTLKLCELSYKASVKHFVFISSMFSLLKKNAAQYSIYAVSKKHAQELIELYCTTHPLPFTILRPSQVYGNIDDFSSKQPFFYHIISQAQKGLDIDLYGGNDAKRNYIYIDDLTRVVNKVIQRKIEGKFDCMYINDVTYSQIAQAAYNAFNKKGVVNFLKDKPDIPNNVFEKDFTLYDKIDFYPVVSIEEGIKKIAGLL